MISASAHAGSMCSWSATAQKVMVPTPGPDSRHGNFTAVWHRHRGYRRSGGYCAGSAWRKRASERYRPAAGDTSAPGGTRRRASSIGSTCARRRNMPAAEHWNRLLAAHRAAPRWHRSGCRATSPQRRTPITGNAEPRASPRAALSRCGARERAGPVVTAMRVSPCRRGCAPQRVDRGRSLGLPLRHVFDQRVGVIATEQRQLQAWRGGIDARRTLDMCER